MFRDANITLSRLRTLAPRDLIFPNIGAPTHETRTREIPDLHHLSCTYFHSPTRLTSPSGCRTSQLSRLPLSTLRRYSLDIPIGDLSNTLTAQLTFIDTLPLLNLELLHASAMPFWHFRKIQRPVLPREISSDEFRPSVFLVRIHEKEEMSPHETCCRLTNLRRFRSTFSHNFSSLLFSNLEGLSLLSFDDFEFLRKEFLHALLAENLQNMLSVEVFSPAHTYSKNPSILFSESQL
jgi:hypothetical protein